MRFEPVHLPPDRRLNGRVSQTMLRHYNGCPRSGYLYAAYKGEASTVEMERGKAVHTAIERIINATIEQEAASLPPELGKAIGEEVLAATHLPVEEHDYVRESLFRFADEWEITGTPIAVEQLIVLELAGWQVRMKVDYAAAQRDGRTVYVADFKSGRGAPSFEDVARKRPDGSLSAKNFQLLLYALGLAFGKPIEVEECPDCDGMGLRLIRPGGDPQAEVDEPCRTCREADYVEVVYDRDLAPRVQQFEMEFVFPGIEDHEGRMLRRPVSLTKLELEEYRQSFVAVLERLSRSEESGDWPAIVSDAACAECPAKSLCPIPRELRDHRGVINSVEQAADALEVMDRWKAINLALGKEIKGFARARGLREIRFGRDKARRFVAQPKTEIRDRDGMFAAMERAVRYGEEFDRSAWVRTRTATEFRDVTLSVDELAEEGSKQEAA